MDGGLINYFSNIFKQIMPKNKNSQTDPTNNSSFENQINSKEVTVKSSSDYFVKTSTNEISEMKQNSIPAIIGDILDYLFTNYASNIPLEKIEGIRKIDKGLNIIIVGSNKVGKKTFEKCLNEFLQPNRNKHDITIKCTNSISTLSDIESRQDLFPFDKIPVIVHLVALDEKRLLDKNHYSFVNHVKKQYGNPVHFLVFTRSKQLLNLLNQYEEDDNEKEEVYKNISNIIRITIDFYVNKRINLKEVLFFEKEIEKVYKFTGKLEELLENRQEIENLKNEMIISSIKTKTYEDDYNYNIEKSKKFEKSTTEIWLTEEKMKFEETIKKINDIKMKDLIKRLNKEIINYEYILIEKLNYIVEKETGKCTLRKYLKNQHFYDLIISLEKFNKEFEKNNESISYQETEDYRSKILEYSKILYEELIRKIQSDNEILNTSREIREIIEKVKFQSKNDKDILLLFKGKCENQKLLTYFKNFKIPIE